MLPDKLRSTADTRSVQIWLAGMLFASIFLQRFAIPFGETGTAANLFLTCIALLVLSLRGALAVDPLRMLLLIAFITCVWASSMLNPSQTSGLAVVLLIVTYTPHALSLRNPENIFEANVRAYRGVMTLCACFGIAQFLAQFVVPSKYLFTFAPFIPAEYLIGGYNTVIPITYGSAIFKSNGFFFLEPSFFSQYLAIAIVLEVLFFQSATRMLVYSTASVVTYSGTGFILLILLLPALLIRACSYKMLAAIVIFGIIAVLFGGLWNIDALLQRTNELGAQNTSATIRFLSGFWLIADFLFSSSQDFLFGLGPGTFLRYQALVAYEINDPPWAKLLFEYGLLGSITFWVYFGVMAFQRAPSVWISAALTIGFLTFGGTLADARIQVLLLLFCTLPKGQRVRVMRA